MGALTTFFIYFNGAILIGPPAIVLELWGMPLIEVPLWTPSCKIKTNMHPLIIVYL
jgi:hypothetical protein